VVSDSDVLLDDGMLAPGYGQLNDCCLEAIYEGSECGVFTYWWNAGFDLGIRNWWVNNCQARCLKIAILGAWKIQNDLKNR